MSKLTFGGKMARALKSLYAPTGKSVYGDKTRLWSLPETAKHLITNPKKAMQEGFKESSRGLLGKAFTIGLPAYTVHQGLKTPGKRLEGVLGGAKDLALLSATGKLPMGAQMLAWAGGSKLIDKLTAPLTRTAKKPSFGGKYSQLMKTQNPGQYGGMA